jgi:hypothetical protein
MNEDKSERDRERQGEGTQTRSMTERDSESIHTLDYLAPGGHWFCPLQ